MTVVTGAGISVASGLPTFRGANGLWEGYRLEDVASPEAWSRDRSLVLRFYNERRRQLATAQPNPAHVALAALARLTPVTIVSQNVDDLHERAGSTGVIHVHGELTKARSSLDHTLISDIGYADILIGQRCARGSQLRPHIIWFGEAVLDFSQAVAAAQRCTQMWIVGTSLEVFPVASLWRLAPRDARIFLIDPAPPENLDPRIEVVAERAEVALPALVAGYR